MPEFADLVSAALDTDSAQEAGDRVTRVVLDEIKRLDPTVDAAPTGYFNHSYVPDLVVRSKDASRRFERHVFLRHSMRSSRAAGDLQDSTNADASSLVLSLSSEESQEETTLARRAVARNGAGSRTLITTVPAIDELSKPIDGADPVLGVVKASVIRSAKGVFLEGDVEKLVLTRERRLQPSDFEAFSEVVSASFTEDAVVRINRVANIVEQALAESPSAITIPESGQLTSSEIIELVPYLLKLEGVTQEPAFWESVARLIRLEDIERYWAEFSNLDMTPLATAGADIWRATRAILTQRAEAIDDDNFDRTPRWTIRGRLLCAEVGDWRVGFAHAGTKLKVSGREASPARWEDLRPGLVRYTVTGVGLAGVVTRSTYGAVEDADMKTRVDVFIGGADDSFHVPSITITTGSGEDQVQIAADFGEMMLRARPDASLATLTSVALDILGYRYPTPTADLLGLLPVSTIVATTESGDEAS